MQSHATRKTGDEDSSQQSIAAGPSDEVTAQMPDKATPIINGERATKNAIARIGRLFFGLSTNSARMISCGDS